MDLATVDTLLTTTRTVRKRLDLSRPVEPEVIQTCLEIAIQAPTGGNIPRYHFVVLTDTAKRARVAELYRKAMDDYLAARQLDREVARRESRLFDSALYLAEHLHEVPVHIIACVEYMSSIGSDNIRGMELANILPATWSLMLALRARGLGAAWTTLHVEMYEQEAAALLGIPEHIRQAVLLAVAYYTGKDFKPAKRLPARERTYWNAWGETR